MGSTPLSRSPSPEFLAVFRAHAAPDGSMSFARFMELALYHPEVGYYRRSRTRIGYAAGTDFYTASSTGALFGELVAAACAGRLRADGRDPRKHDFVEIGAENTDGVLAKVNHPFASARTVRTQDEIKLSGDCVVFSNELFDAQPCVRTIARSGEWREIFVKFEGDALLEIEKPFSGDGAAQGDGYCFDRPVAATALARAIAEQDWSGLFVAFDYGKTLRELAEETPAGTVRAYFRHTQSNDLLARPGEQDLTCHVCWDWITDSLCRHGFTQAELNFQESFFIRQAGEAIAAITAAEASRFSSRKMELLQVLHPARMGQKFQVLHAIR